MMTFISVFLFVPTKHWVDEGKDRILVGFDRVIVAAKQDGNHYWLLTTEKVWLEVWVGDVFL